MARTASTKRKTARVPSRKSYLFRIEALEPHYSLSSNTGRSGEAGLSEYLHPEIRTVCLAPSKFEGRRTTFTLLGDRNLLNDAALGHAPTGIGTLTFRGDRSTYLGPLPFDAALALPAMILLDGYRYIYLNGEPTRHGSARISFLSFYRDFDFVDL